MSWPRATKLRRLAHCAAQRFAPGGLILLYHRVAESRPDPWSLCVSPNHFAEHLEVLRGRVGRLTDIVGKESAGGGACGRFAITFDDGYADVLLAARPLLERHETPATVFVSTGAVDDGQPFWWDELTALIESAPGGRLQHELHGQLSVLDASTRREQLAALRAWAGVDAPAAMTARPLTREEILRLAADELVEIGAHSVSHPKLPALAPTDQEREIRGSRSFLVELLGRPVTSFAYPHGRHDVTTRRSVLAAGFERACTSQLGRVRPHTDALRLPRLTVPDCDGDAFARMLRRLAF